MQQETYFQKLENQINDIYIPKNIKSFNKIKIKDIRLGMYISWYYKDDLKFYKSEKLNIRDYNQYIGIIIPKPEIEYRSSSLNADDCLVCIFGCPCEKCYPETDLIPLKVLIDNDELVEVYEIENKCK